MNKNLALKGQNQMIFANDFALSGRLLIGGIYFTGRCPVLNY